MRKVIVANIMSLDGSYDGPGRDVMAMPFDHTFDRFNVEHLRAARTLLLGRESFEGFQSYWPKVAEDASASPESREISRLDNAIEKLVVSDSLPLEQTGPWASTTTVIRREFVLETSFGAPQLVAASCRTPLVAACVMPLGLRELHIDTDFAQD